MKAFVRIVREIEPHNYISSEIFADRFPHKHLHEWMKHALITSEEATEVYMVEVIAESHYYKQ